MLEPTRGRLIEFSKDLRVIDDALRGELYRSLANYLSLLCKILIWIASFLWEKENGESHPA